MVRIRAPILGDGTVIEKDGRLIHVVWDSDKHQSWIHKSRTEEIK